MTPHPDRRSSVRQAIMTPLSAGTGIPRRPSLSSNVLSALPNYTNPIVRILSGTVDFNDDRKEDLVSLHTVKQGTLVEKCLPSHCSRDVKDKLFSSYNSLIDYLVIYGFDPKGQKSSPTLAHWQLCSAECGWMKFLKYKISAFFSIVLGEVLPPCPFSTRDNPLHLIGGRAGRFVSKILKTSSRLQFATGILYLKKGLARPGKKELDAAVSATKKVLTNLRNVPVPTIDFIDDWDNQLEPLTLTDMSYQIRRTVRDVFVGHKITERDLHKPYAPSIKANYVDSRSKFGTFGTLVDVGLIGDNMAGVNPDVIFRDVLQGSEVSEFREGGSGLALKGLKPDFKWLVESIYTNVYEKARRLASEEVADVKLVGIAEALKVRTISKGPPLTYFTLKPVQKFLHKIMRKLKIFNLIGQPVSPKILKEVFPNAIPGFQFHSLDYSSATDFLNPFLSNECADEISKVISLPDDLRALFLKALTGHLVEGEDQVWGQLMGSIMSFIVLCIVNAAVIRYSLEVTHDCDFTLDECPAVVNGDDGLVHSTPEFLDIWTQIASLCGLEPSQGKVYSHTQYLNINSTSFLHVSDVFILVPYVNMGLVNGMTRSGEKKELVTDIYDDSRIGSIGARHHALITSCPSELRLATHKMFIKKNFKILNVAKVPWFVSESNGGLGLKPIESFTLTGDADDIDSYEKRVDVGPSRMDIDLLKFLNDPRLGDLRFRRLPTVAPIQVRSVWSSRLGEPSRDLLLSDRDIGFLDVACYYLCPSLVMKEVEAQGALILRRNERVWSALARRYAALMAAEAVGVVALAGIMHSYLT